MFEQELTIFSNKVYVDKEAFIVDMAEVVASKITGRQEYIEAVKDRESTMSTYIEYGVAIPHGKTDAVTTPFVIYVKLEHGIEWGDDNELANHVFMIGVPMKQSGNLHLKIISELSKNLMRENFRQRRNRQNVFW